MESAEKDERMTKYEEEHLINYLRGLEGYHYNWRELAALKRLVLMNIKLEQENITEFYNDLGWEVIEILIDEIEELKGEIKR